MYVEYYNYMQTIKFKKNAKAHNVYHRCLCFISDQTMLA